MLHRSPFDGAKFSRHGRRHTEALLDAAFLILEARKPTAAELADLTEAVDAFGRGRYESAVNLARAAIAGRSRERSAWHPAMTRSLDDVRLMLTAIAQARAAGSHPGI